MPRRLRLRTDGRESVAEVAGGDVLFVDSGEAVTVREQGDGRFRVDGERLSALGVAVMSGGTVWVSIDGAVFDVHVSDGAGRQAASSQDALSPPMPATVVRIAVTPGQRVSQGDLLIALEAMKMELALRAPRDGVVGAIHCREGELVQPETVLVELEQHGGTRDPGS